MTPSNPARLYTGEVRDSSSWVSEKKALEAAQMLCGLPNMYHIQVESWVFGYLICYLAQEGNWFRRREIRTPADLEDVILAAKKDQLP